MTLWAALSASGLRGLRLPTPAGRLTIAPDNDGAGRSAADVLSRKARAFGWTATIRTPPEGGDFNDVLTGKVVAK